MPGIPFTDAVVQYVEKNDKHAMESFVEDSLNAQFKEMMGIDDLEENLETQMEIIRKGQEQLFAAGKKKHRQTKAKLKPRPENWDSDMEGCSWAEFPGSKVFEEAEGVAEDEDGSPAPTKKRARKTGADDDDDNASVASGKKAPVKKAPAKRVPAKPKTTVKAPAKPKVPAKTTAAAKKNAVQAFEISDDEDPEDEDVVMQDDPPPKPKAQPRRAAAVRGGKQTQLTFTQSQAKTQTARELSDDEIDDDDDAFEPIIASSSSKRR